MADKEEKNNKDFNSVYGQPFSLPKEKQKEIVKYFYDQIEEAKKNEVTRIAELTSFSDLYEDIRPAKTFPWEDCANIPLPITADSVDTVSERLLNRTFSSEIVYNVTGEDDYSIDHEEEIENWLNYIIKEDLDLFKKSDSIFHNVAKYGDADIALTFERKETRIKKWKSPGLIEGAKNLFKGKNVFNQVLVEESEVKKVAHLELFDPEDIIVPISAKDNPEELEWIALFYYPTYADLEDLASKYENLELIKGQETEVEKQIKTAEETGQNLEPGKKKSFVLCVVLARYDINEDKKRENCVFIFEYKTKVYLRGSFNPYFHNEKFVIPFRIHPITNSWHGRGISKLTKPLNLECEALNNQTIDNANLVINKVLTYLRGVGINTEKDKIYPGAMLGVNTHDDIRVLPLGDINYSGIALLKLMQSFAQLRSGIGGYQSGMAESADPRSPARKTELLIGQTDLRIDTFFKRVNDGFKRLARQIVSLYAQYGDKQLEYKKWDDKAKKYKIIKLDRKILIEGKWTYNLNGVTMDVNKEKEKQDELFLFDTLLKSPIFTQPPTALAQMSETQLKSLYELTKNLLQKFGRQNTDKYLPNFETLLQSIKDQVAIEIENQMKQAAMIAMGSPKVPPMPGTENQPAGGGTQPPQQMGGM